MAWGDEGASAGVGCNLSCALVRDPTCSGRCESQDCAYGPHLPGDLGYPLSRLAQSDPMSRTTTVSFGDRKFWALSDAFGAWLAYLVEVADAHTTEPESWLGEQTGRWKVAASITDFGADITAGTADQIGLLRDYALEARELVITRGPLSREDLQGWIVVDDLAVNGGNVRIGDVLSVERILEVADAFIALVNGTLPPDPPGGTWFVGTGDGYRTMSERR